MKHKKFLLLFLLMVLVHCGGSASDNGFEEGGQSAADISATQSPFEGLSTGDDFTWGEFINSPYSTTAVTTLPIPIYLVFFTDAEKQAVLDGIDMANLAVGFDVFEVVDEWQADARTIYKVDDIDFDDPEFVPSTTGSIIGYTYHGNVYIDGKYDAGRIVVDWSMELKSGNISKWVVAHELGHAMGIQSHAMIDYDTDTLTDLEPNSLMSAQLPNNPVLNDYNTMMEKQGELLLTYMQENGTSN